MKVLVFAHRLELGGTQTNAVELAAQLRDQHGHDVTIMATPGPATALVEQRALRYIALPDADRHPSPAIVRAVAHAVKAEQPDLLHVWDWPQCFDAYPTHLLRKTPMLCTVMSMTVPEFLPRSLPTTFGTEELVAEATKLRRGVVALLEPPVDITVNAPGVVDTSAFVAEHDLDPAAAKVVTVSRLVEWLKLEAIVRAIDALRDPRLAGAQLVVVGEGTAAAEVAARADEVNRAVGRRAVVLTGGLVDPRPAYEIADVVVGMGSSALRAAAFAKPLVVVGEQGFSEILDETTTDVFLWQGFYGLGDGDRSPDRLAGQLAALVADPDRRAALAGLGRRMVEDRFSLERAASKLATLYRDVAGTAISRPVLLGEGLRTTGWRVGSRLLPAQARRRLAPLKRV